MTERHKGPLAVVDEVGQRVLYPTPQGQSCVFDRAITVR
jgi:hypothetical protein